MNVWTADLDDGKYACKVERLSQSQGRLTVTETATEKVVIDQKVGLSYGALFGPDHADVLEWQRIIEEKLPAPDKD